MQKLPRLQCIAYMALTLWVHKTRTDTPEYSTENLYCSIMSESN